MVPVTQNMDNAFTMTSHPQLAKQIQASSVPPTTPRITMFVVDVTRAMVEDMRARAATLLNLSFPFDLRKRIRNIVVRKMVM